MEKYIVIYKDKGDRAIFIGEYKDHETALQAMLASVQSYRERFEDFQRVESWSIWHVDLADRSWSVIML